MEPLSVTLIRRTLPVAILTTCKIIHQEARDVVKELVRELIVDAAPKLICSSGAGFGVVANLLRRMLEENLESEALY